jgi:hypothetical protein
MSASSGTPWRASPALRVERSESNAIGAGAIASHAIIVVFSWRALCPQVAVPPVPRPSDYPVRVGR